MPRKMLVVSERCQKYQKGAGVSHQLRDVGKKECVGGGGTLDLLVSDREYRDTLFVVQVHTIV
jgi:hypothetical protein